MSARIVEAERTSEHSTARRFFIHSASTPGAWWRVDFAPGEAESLTCSCPHGRRITTALRRIAEAGSDTRSPRSCWHLVAITQRLVDEHQAVA